MPTVSQDEFDLDKLDVPISFPYYAYRDARNCALLGHLGPVLSLSRGHVVHEQGVSKYCYMVLDGQVGAVFRDSDGLMRPIAFFLEGSLFLEPAVLTGRASNISFKADMPSRLVRISGEDLKAAMLADSGVFDAVMHSITMKMDAGHEQLRETARLDVRARIYYLLLGIAATCSEPAGAGWHRLTLKLTQQQMSDMLGVNRVTVNTALHDLYDRRIVRKHDGFYALFDGKGLLA